MHFRCLILAAITFSACSNAPDVLPAPVPAPDYAAAPTDARLFAAVVERWSELGFPSASKCELPREVLADDQMFEELCGKGSLGAQACQTHDALGPLLVIIDGWQLERRRFARTRAHEAAHWLAACTGVATARENFEHAVPNVWFEDQPGDDYVLRPWAQP